MNNFILHPAVQDFIDKNLSTDIAKLIFQGSPFKEVQIQELAEQIEAKNRCKDKLPSWYSKKGIYFPNKLNLEQTSSEITAAYKSNLISGQTIIDLTGGFGIDSYFFSKRFKSVIHCETNKGLSEIAAYNFNQFDIHHVDFVPGDGLQILKNSKNKLDWIYADPSRRNDQKGKVFLLNDCLPNIPEHLNSLFAFSDNLLIKTSPILDIKQAISELNFVKEVHIVAVQNEVKELLFVLKYNYKSQIGIKSINIQKTSNQIFNFNLNSASTSHYSEALKYLYEPNAALMKSGGFNYICEQLNVLKLHPNSHLFTSNDLIKFPGRTFKIKKVTPFDRKILKLELPSGKANISTRNFPNSVAEIRKKTKLKDGGSAYLFFTTAIKNKPIVLICEKV